MAVRVHTLDMCALSDLAEHSTYGLARHRLLEEVAAERILVLGTMPLLWELPALYGIDLHLFHACFDLLLRVTRRRVLLNPVSRQEHEVRTRGRLSYPAFVDDTYGIVYPDDAAEFTKAAAHNLAHAEELQAEEKKKAGDSAAFLDEEARRQATEQGEEFDPDAWRRSLKRASRAFWYDQADHAAKGAMERACARAGVPTEGLDHRRLPSCWASGLIHAARVRAVLVGGTNPAGKKAVGNLDLLHLDEAAAYANVFVTSDRRLRAFATSVAEHFELRCEVLSVETWAERLTR